RALRHVGQHGVTCVADQHDALLAPSRQRIALHQRPFAHFGTTIENDARLGVKAGESRAQLLKVATRRPRFDLEIWLWRAGEEIELVATRIHLVAYDMAAGSPPLDPIVNLGAEALAPVDRAIGDLPGETRLAGAEDNLQHGGMDAVRADHRVGADFAAVGECKSQAVAGTIEPDKL